MASTSKEEKTVINNNQKPELHRVYLGPEETVTDVRERLTHLLYERIALVVPQETQLHHVVAWKLLARCAEELGKEVVIASSDRQVRALARTVHLALIPDILPSERSTPPTQRRNASRKARGRAS
jgi:hypothetical protein